MQLAHRPVHAPSPPPPCCAAAKPDVKPWLIPFNSADDTAETGYIGSLSRNMRTWLQLQDCAAHPWPNGTWSPAGEDASARPPPGSFKALKRAENFLGAIVVPMSQLNGAWETYATQVGQSGSGTPPAAPPYTQRVVPLPPPTAPCRPFPAPPQAILLADSTDLTYYWRTIQNNGYQSLRLADLAGKGRMTWAIGPTDTPFAQDAAGKGTPMD